MVKKPKLALSLLLCRLLLWLSTLTMMTRAITSQIPPLTTTDQMLSTAKDLMTRSRIASIVYQYHDGFLKRRQVALA